MVFIGRIKKESTFSVDIRRALQRKRIMSWKVNDRTARGIPDIYLISGTWIESKVIPTLPTSKNFPLKYFTTLQRVNLDTFQKRGDKCFAAILYHGDYSRSWMVMPWWHFRRIKIWDVHTLGHFSVPWIGPASMDLTPFGWDDGAWNGPRWKAEVWDTWSDKDNMRAFAAEMDPEVLNFESEDYSEGEDEDGEDQQHP